MHPSLRLAFLAPLLTSCLNATFHDTLVRAELEGPLPHAPVHLPGPDSGFAVQTSLAVNVSPTDRIEIQLLEPDKKDPDDNTGHARSVHWNRELVQGSGEVSVFLGRSIRLLGGIQGDLEKKSLWGGAGILLGKRYPLEIGFTAGNTSISRELEGNRITVLSEDCRDAELGTCSPSSQSFYGSDSTTWDRTDVPFNTISVTWSRRGGGPWLEGSRTQFTRLARTVEGDWTYDATNLRIGGGWTFPMELGTFVAGARVESMGEGLNPSLVAQWTGLFPLD
ncbi:MAG: hypothetical protein H6686_04305 [Fibrobacteria bacterium]|nr:hypothetical protein [Fibrobacteria bacterium]